MNGGSKHSTGDAAAPVPSETPVEKTGATRAALVQLYNEVKSCQRCGLGKNRIKLVFGSGNVQSPVMIIGEAPGMEEDRQGKPFVGEAGALLTKMLSAIDLDRDKDVFITNILKCRPPQNRDPAQTETAACMPILIRQIAVIAPKVILCLGRIAAMELLHTTAPVGELRSVFHSYGAATVVVTYHPAALLRNPAYKRPAWEDLRKLAALIKDKGLYGAEN